YSLVCALCSMASGFSMDEPYLSQNIVEAIATKITHEFINQGHDISFEDALKVVAPILANLSKSGSGSRLTSNETQFRSMWKSMCQEDAFRMTIAMYLKVGYPALFFAYEDFVMSCYRLVTGLP